jgi:hypothetical protein
MAAADPVASLGRQLAEINDQGSMLQFWCTDDRIQGRLWVVSGPSSHSNGRHADEVMRASIPTRSSAQSLARRPARLITPPFENGFASVRRSNDLGLVNSNGIS